MLVIDYHPVLSQNNFPTVENKLIPLYCNGRRGSLVDALGIGFISACNQTEGVWPVSKITLNNGVSNKQDWVYLNTSYGR